MGITAKKKPCDGPCGEHRRIWRNFEGKRYCQSCWLRVKTVTGVLKPTNKQPLSLRSPRKSKEDSQYTKMRKLFLLANPMCKAHVATDCSHYSTDVHHRRGRGKYYLDVSTWLSTCRQCHSWIHLNPKQAKELGFYK